MLGMLIASILGWHRVGRILGNSSTGISNLIGYSLTYRGVRKQTNNTREAIKITAATGLRRL